MEWNVIFQYARQNFCAGSSLTIGERKKERKKERGNGKLHWYSKKGLFIVSRPDSMNAATAQERNFCDATILVPDGSETGDWVWDSAWPAERKTWSYRGNYEILPSTIFLSPSFANVLLFSTEVCAYPDKHKAHTILGYREGRQEVVDAPLDWTMRFDGACRFKWALTATAW